MSLSALSLASVLLFAPPTSAGPEPEQPLAAPEERADSEVRYIPADDTAENPADDTGASPADSVTSPEAPPAEQIPNAETPASATLEPATLEPATLEPEIPGPPEVAKSAEPAKEVSPLVPPSQLQFLSAHPVDLERVQFRPGKGLSFMSKSGKFALTMGLRAQFLYELEHDEANEPATGHSFQVRRARLVFAGHVFGEHNKFKTELSFSPKDIGLVGSSARFTILRDFYMEFDYLRDFTVRVGQYKLPYSQQRVISSGKLQLVDRSIVGSEFDLDRDIGLDIRSEDFLGVDRLRYYLGVYFGGGRDNYALEPLREGGGLVYIARFEVLPFGTFDDYVEGDFKRTKKPRLSLGGAYSYMPDATVMRGTKGSIPTDGGTTDYHNATASMMFKIVGLSLSGEFFWRRGQRDPGDLQIEDEFGDLVAAPIELPRNGLGWYMQGGYMIPRVPVEIAARFSQVRALGAETQTSMSDRQEVGGGLNWYPGGHPFKLQLDYFRIWGDDIANGMDQVRLQAQISF